VTAPAGRPGGAAGAAAPGGRFAPSPTGPLHLGSLVAAVASYLDARAAGVPWFVRIDDIDAPRSVAGAEDAILRSLEAHGLHWDGPVQRQSQRLDRYRDALNRIAAAGRSYRCRCSRRQLDPGRPYPGTCRTLALPEANTAVRVRVDDRPVVFEDRVCGRIETRLDQSCGDFVIWRRDGLVSYQLATAVDDGQPEIGRVTRGGDLLENTARQLYLMRCLGLTEPGYAHVPIVVDAAGAKLSKQHGAPPLDERHAAANLYEALALLGMAAPPGASSCARLLAWAVANFRWQAVPRERVVQAS